MFGNDDLTEFVQCIISWLMSFKIMYTEGIRYNVTVSYCYHKIFIVDWWKHNIKQKILHSTCEKKKWYILKISGACIQYSYTYVHVYVKVPNFHWLPQYIDHKIDI